jgi:hypothetical protein
MRPIYTSFASAIAFLTIFPTFDGAARAQDGTPGRVPFGNVECAPDGSCTSTSPFVSQEAALCSGMSLGAGADLNGFDPFPISSLWNTDVSGLGPDSSSDNIIHFIGATVTLHPDFGSGTFSGSSIGIPYQVVAGTQPKVNVTLGVYASESDPGPMPIPPNALIEGFPKPGDGDRHVLVLDRDNCFLYELYNARVHGSRWSASSTAVWDMMVNSQRPYTWTSADAAGLPIFAGLVRYDEVAAGEINHALRFTVRTTRRAFTPPASHWASSNTDPNAPPMGTRLRLKPGFDITPFPADVQVILTALKKYGMILADNGSSVFISGVPDSRWNNTNLRTLQTIQASEFEVVRTDPVYTPGNVPTGLVPVISEFTASPTTVGSGEAVTLRWTVNDAIYNIISPQAGAVRGTSVIVRPTNTSTYTLYATNQFGRSTRPVTVTVR